MVLVIVMRSLLASVSTCEREEGGEDEEVFLVLMV